MPSKALNIVPVELLPCPTCGHKAVVQMKDTKYGTMYKIVCDNCKRAAGPWRYLKHAAAAEWNIQARSDGGDNNGKDTQAK